MLVTGCFLEFRSERSLEILATNVKISGMVWLHGCLTSDPCTTQFPPQVPAVEVVTWRVSTRLSMSWTRTLMTACLRMRWPVALLQYEQGGCHMWAVSDSDSCGCKFACMSVFCWF
jgi:hypothetical protein